MTSGFIEEAKKLETVSIVVRFAGRAGTSEERGAELVNLRSQEVQRVVYAGDLATDDPAKLMEFAAQNVGIYTTKAIYTNKQELIKVLSERLPRILRRQNYDQNSLRYAKSICHVLTALELIDTEGDPTIYGNRLLKFWKSGDHESYCRYVGEVVLRKGGWTLVIVQLDALGKTGARKRQLHEGLAEALTEKRSIRGIWSIDALVQCMIDLEFIKPWDSVLRRYEILWERLAQLLRGSAME